MDNISIYVHWPFCLSLCPYCDFNSHIAKEIDHELWLQSYIKELENFSDKFFNKKIKTIFFGGGTPSLMEPKIVNGLIEYLSKKAYIDQDTEITLEANPTSYEINKFVKFKNAGINRVSVGIQSLNDKSLKLLGRKHSSTEALKAVESVRKIFKKYSFDLIYAITDQSLEDWQKELEQAVNYCNGHISLYQLTIEKGTPFYKKYQNGTLILPENDLAANMYNWTNDYLFQKKYTRYEISNYAQQNYQCKHNLAYWNYKEYLGIGPGAHSRLHNFINNKYNIEAITMLHNPYKWLEMIKEHGNAVQNRVFLSDNEVIEEVLMMGCRLEEGLCTNNFKNVTGHNLSDVLNMDLVNQYQYMNLLVVDSERIKLTDKGLLLHSYIIPRILK